MFERYTESARRVVFFARYEASQLGASSIDTEHLLLGVLREDKAMIDLLLPELRGRAEPVRAEIAARIAPGEKISTSVDLPLSADAKLALGIAKAEADSAEHRHIGLEELLLGLLRNPSSVAFAAMRAVGLDAEGATVTLRNRIASLVDAELMDEQTSGVVDRRLSAKAARIVVSAREEARMVGARVAGPLHLLLALVKEDKWLFAHVGGRIVTSASIMAELAVAKPHSDIVLLDPAVLQTIAGGVQAATTWGRDRADSEHLLLGLLKVRDPVAEKLLATWGVSEKRLLEVLTTAPN